MRQTISTPSIALCLLLIDLLLFGVPPSFAADSPHNSVNAVSCTSCHNDQKAAENPDWWTRQDLHVCGTCHNSATEFYAVTHEKSGAIIAQCTVCHDPHRQQQNRQWKAASYLYSSTSDLVGGITGTALKKTGAGWTINQWKDMLLLPNTAAPAYIYRIVSNTSDTIFIDTRGEAPDNQINTSSVKSGNTFALVRGNYVKPVIGGKYVRFFRETGTNSFADDTPTIDGVCQVCHTATSSFSTTGALEGPGHPLSQTGKKCTSCHGHKSGFRGDCKSCHGTPPVVNTPGDPDGLPDDDEGTGSATTGAHSKHAVAIGYTCDTCHTGGMPESVIYDKKVEIGFNIANGAYQTGAYNGRDSIINGYTYSSGNAGTTVTQGEPTPMQCSNVYCHGSTILSGGTDRTPEWATPATGACGTCHGISSGSNYPDRGSHTRHTGPTAGNIGYEIGCQICHKTTTNTGDIIADQIKHVNNAADWSFDTTDSRVSSAQYRSASSGAVSNPPSTSYGSCSTVYCHSKGQSDTGGALLSGDYATPEWNVASTGQCGQCHNATAGSAPPTTGSHSKHAGPSSSGSYAFACTACHYGFSETSSAHADRIINVAIDPQNGNSATSGADGQNVQRGFTGSTCSNTYCHSQGTSISTGTISSNTSSNWGSGTLSCGSCHGFPPDYANNSPKANSHSAHKYKNCNNCHSSTTSDGATITNTANHVNKQYDLEQGAGSSFTYTFNTSGGSCSNISCHGYGTPQWGNTSCLGCHNISQGSRAAISPQFTANSHHIQGGELADSHCYQCHWEANSDGSINSSYHGGSGAPASPVNLVIYGAGARPAAYTLETTAIEYTANGSRSEIQRINTHCLGCHSDQNNSTEPFEDGKTPKQYAWDGSSIDKRYSQTDTTPWGKYSSTTYTNVDSKDILTKAYSAHGNAANNQAGWSINLWGNTLQWTDKSGSINVACFDCHNSHGSTVTGTTTNYTSATTNGGIFKDTTANKGGYTVDYKPEAGGSSDNKNAYNPGAALCFDCHATPDSGTSPWGYSETFSSTQSILGYRDTPYFGPGTSGSQQRYVYKQNMSNSGGHLGASSTMSTTPAGTINGLCTPCHDPHGVSATLGTDQQYAVPLLKGTWMASPYKEDAAPSSPTDLRPGYRFVGSWPVYNIDQNTFCSPTGNQWNWNCATRITETPSRFGGLCLQCHPKSSISPDTNSTWKSMDRIHNTVQGWGGYGANANNAVHSYTCSKCHTPHNSRLPRLMITNCLDSSHRARVAYGGNAGQSSYSDSGSHGHGNGSGGFPGGGTGLEYAHGSSTPTGTVNFFFGNTASCHSSTNSSSWPSNQRWNEKTNWVVPTAPVIITTANAQCSSACSITLQWNPSSITNGDPIQYYVEVDTTTAFNSSNLQNSGWIDGTSWTVTLNTNATYYWRVRARDKLHPAWVSAWSSGSCGFMCIANTFYLSDGIEPPVVTQLSPANGSTVGATCADWNLSSGSYWCSYGTTLTWEALPPHAQYNVQVSTDPAFNTVNFTCSWTSGTSCFSGVNSSGTYYWRVQARDTLSQATGQLSPTWSFTVVGPPSTPELITTPDTQCSGSCSVPLQWNTSTSQAGAPEYYVQVDTTSNFNSGNLQSSEWMTDTTWSPTLNTNTKYYWRVRSRDQMFPSAFSAWSTTGNFYLSDGDAPPEVTLSYPPTGYTYYCNCNIDCTSLNWNAAPPLVQYNVQVSTDPAFSTLFAESGWSLSYTYWNAFTSTPGTPGVTYYWRVQARDTASLETGPWSSAWTYTCQ